MHTRDEWKHYRVHKRNVGRPVNGEIVWTREWEVRFPWGHELMQGDNWEKVAYKKFDTFTEAMDFAHLEATKDKIRYEIEENLDEEVDRIARSILYEIPQLLSTIPMFA